MNQVTEDILEVMTPEMLAQWEADAVEIRPRPGALDGRCNRCGVELHEFEMDDHDDWHEGLSITIWMQKKTIQYLLSTLAAIKEGLEDLLSE